DFRLGGTNGTEHALSDYRGRNVVLFFFPRAFTGTCERQVSTHAHEIEKFKALNAVVLGVSTDQTPSQAAFARQCDPEGAVTLLSDFRHKVVRQYGVYLEEGPRPNGRATFIIDKDGILRYQHVEPDPGQWAGPEPEYDALQKLQ
ncbi:MAG: redoxin domain-containing protein, partial [Chloroflexota bacterium]